MGKNDKRQEIFWGEIHGHTEMSDGTGKFEGLYTNARNVDVLILPLLQIMRVILQIINGNGCRILRIASIKIESSVHLLDTNGQEIRDIETSILLQEG